MRVERTPGSKRSTTSCVTLAVLVLASLVGSTQAVSGISGNPDEYSCTSDSHCQFWGCNNIPCSGHSHNCVNVEGRRFRQARCIDRECIQTESWSWWPYSYCPEPPVCAAGNFSPLGDGKNGGGEKACQQCPPGKFQTATGSAVCIDCEAGKYSVAVGASTCSGSLCAAGKYGPLGSTSSAAATCTSCTAGKFQPTEGSSNCTSCGAGKYASSAGLSVCVGARV